MEPKQGKILISEPLMNDFHFGRAVILLIDHVESEGSFGIIINKKLEVQVNHIVDGLYWGGDHETLATLIHTGIANEDNVRFYLGYSGWDAGQLVGELVRNSWLIGDITAEEYLSTPPDKMWQTFVDRMGNPYEMWKRFPKDFQDN